MVSAERQRPSRREEDRAEGDEPEERPPGREPQRVVPRRDRDLAEERGPAPGDADRAEDERDPRPGRAGTRAGLAQGASASATLSPSPETSCSSSGSATVKWRGPESVISPAAFSREICRLVVSTVRPR